MGMGETHEFILPGKMASVSTLAFLAPRDKQEKLFFGNIPLNAVLKALIGL